MLEIVPVSATGTGVFLAAIISGLFLGVSPATMAATLARRIRGWSRRSPRSSVCCVGFVTKYSGLDTVLGLAFTRTGPLLYPLFGTLLGWVGAGLTGSDTSSNVLFGNLQKITARKLGLNEIPMASANTTGGVMGKMIDAQSIVVAAAATGEGGKEGTSFAQSSGTASRWPCRWGRSSGSTPTSSRGSWSCRSSRADGIGRRLGRSRNRDAARINI